MDTRTLQDLLGRYIQEFGPDVIAGGFTMQDLKRDLIFVSRLDYPLPLDINTAMLLELRTGIYPPTPPAGNYQAAILADNPLGYWRLEEASGSVAADLGSGAQPGTYTAAGAPNDVALWVPRTPSAVVGGLAVTLPTAAFLSLLPGAFSGIDFSCELWFRPVAGLPVGYLVNAVGAGPQINLQLIYNADGTLTAHRRNAAGVIATLNAPAVALNTWHYVVYRRIAGISLSLFVDGVNVASTPDTVGGTPVADLISVGGDPTGTNFTGGMIDEVALYATALTPGQIGTHYAAASAVARSRVPASAPRLPQILERLRSR
jgi:hypothetical protein